ncbi:hypothetical protein TB2_018723 [Malus domestica]
MNSYHFEETVQEAYFSSKSSPIERGVKQLLSTSCKNVEDDETSTRRSSIAITMRDFFLENFFNHSVKTPCYEDCKECLSKIV